jgi:S-methylmethionine-dependent homocysteine/selenocysteine methylase
LGTFSDKLTLGEFILLDGGFGTELARRGFDTSLPLFPAQALLSGRDMVREIHADYIQAGAEVITANTFCTAEVALRTANLEQMKSSLPETSVTLACEAAEDAGKTDVEITASLSPLSAYFPGGNPGETELRAAQEDHAAAIALTGVDLVFCETMTSVREARAALEAADSAGMDAVVSLVPKDARHLLSGETIDTAVRALTPFNPLAICLNCCSIEVMDIAVPTLLSVTDLPVGAYASAASEMFKSKILVPTDVSAIQYVQHARRWQELGVRMIGGCCGTTPEHIKILREKLHTGSGAAEEAAG